MKASLIVDRVPSLRVLFTVLEKPHGSWSAVFVNTQQRTDQGVKLRILELPICGAQKSCPAEDIPLRPEEMLPVVGDVGEDSSQAPHVRRGVRIVSSQNLRSQVADCPGWLDGGGLA